MGLRIAAIILIVTALAYIHTFNTVKDLEMKHLVDHVNERGGFENERFELVEDSQELLKWDLQRQLTTNINRYPLGEFERLFEAWPDGTMRSRRGPNFDGLAFGFIGANVVVDAELQRRVMIYYNLSNQYGPAWHHRIQNLYITSPENLLIGYWPEVPNWAHSLPKDYYVPAEEYAAVANFENNPQRDTVWTGLFYDVGSNQWMASAETPIDIDGHHVATIGNDVLLNELMENTLRNNIDGAYSLIFRKDGRLILHPEKIEAIKNQHGYYDITKSSDRYLQKIYSAVLQNANQDVITLEHDGRREYLSSYFFSGPEWYLVTVLPHALVAGPAYAMARYILLLGLFSLVFEILVLMWVLRKKVTQPLESFTAAVDKIANNEFDVRLDTHRKDELGIIANAFEAMVNKVKQRQQQDADINRRLEELVTERTADLQTAKQEAEYANKQKTEFLGRMSHELRTPMNAILGFGQLLEKQALDIDQTIFLNEVMQASRHLKALIDEVLELSVLESGKISLQNSCFEACGCIAESIAIVQSLADDKSITIDFYPEPEEEYKVYADNTRLKEVLLNLLTNAIKYTDTGGLISIQCRLSNQKLRIFIKDNGNGIAREKQNKIFEPFYRACENTEAIEGTGIGLAIAKKYIQLMGGAIGFKSEPGIGSEFWIDCPLAKEPHLMETQSTSINQTYKVNQQPHTILYVEDNESNLRLIQYLFKYNPSIRLIHARNGRDGISMAQDEKPDLILLDINLPDIDGYQVLQRLNENDITRSIPKLALSASALPRDIEKGIKAGFVHYVTKPIDTNEFQDLIDKLLAQLDSVLTPESQPQFRPPEIDGNSEQLEY